jgi:hypothetical protein
MEATNHFTIVDHLERAVYLRLLLPLVIRL